MHYLEARSFPSDRQKPLTRVQAACELMDVLFGVSGHESGQRLQEQAFT